jgi:type I restriction enzyme, S subunit
MTHNVPIGHEPDCPVVSLGDITTKIGSGATPKGGASAYLPKRSGFALVRSQNVFDRQFDETGLAFISDSQATGLRGVELKPGDILLNITGDGITFGRACIVPPSVLPACVNQHVSIVRVDPQRAHPGFVLAFLTHPNVKSYIESFNAGGSRRAITKGHIESFRLPLPPLERQRAIAYILGSLDDKIELNRRMSETLEEMARALFKSWFVDFDPVRAKAEARDTKLPLAIADRFVGALFHSELGVVPSGWDVTTIGELADVVGGSTPSTKEAAFWDGGSHAWATPKDLSGQSVPVLLDTERRVTDQGLSQIGSGLLPPGTVLLSSRAPIGYLAVAEVPVAINQGFIAMKPKEGISNLFLLFWSQFAKDQILGRANGSTFLEISKANFRPIPVVAPPEEIMLAFDRIVRPLYARIVSCAQESRTLATLRDTLLPKLISGELRVKNAERLVEVAL